VRLTGSYGGEILRDNVAFKPRRLSTAALAPEFAHGFLQAAETFNKSLHGNRLSFIAFKQVPWHHYSRYSLEQSQLTIRSPYLDNDLVRQVYRAPHTSDTGKEFSLRLIREGQPALRSIPTIAACGAVHRRCWTNCG